MADSLNDLARRLVLTKEEEAEVVVEEVHLQPTEAKVGLCLVGKLLTTRPFNFEALRTTLTAVWRASKGIVFKTLGDNLFLIKFGHIVDKRRVMLNGPWNFDKQLVMWRDFDGDLLPLDITFSTMEFWVHVSNLPLISMTRDVGVLLGNQLGRFVDMEYGDGGIAWGQSLCIRVAINIVKPLRRELKLALSGRESVWITLTYEKLPNFCFHCGLLGHSVHDCSTKILGGKEGESVRNSKMLSKDVDVQQGGQGDGSNHSFVPVTAKHRSPEKESMGQSKSGKDNLAPPITGIACIPADLVASLGGLEGGDLPLAPRPDIQTTEGWVGLDHDLHGPNVERVVEVATIGRLGEKLDGQAIVGLGGGWAQALWVDRPTFRLFCER
ncbi:uncharacterized protein LOC114277599 [Camellia sinensis]|uniref:uncharacterized protein LOC114277599 n=1 Tax=Camellia sinensis TaxID=4442 RepID=UPI001036EC07|nr:uncharacterized protein LOC114277599 [Camellia sinensis]